MHPLTVSNRPRSIQSGAFRAIQSTFGQARKEKKLFGMSGFFNRNKKKKGQIKTRDMSFDSEFPYNFDFNAIDYSKKIMRCAWHPTANAVAVAGENNLYVYTQS